MNSELPTHACPKCKYVRKPTDAAPDWQCPSCGIAYAKFGKTLEPSHLAGEQGHPLERRRKTSFWKKFFTKADTGKHGSAPSTFFLMGIAALLIAVELMREGEIPGHNGHAVTRRSDSPLAFWFGISIYFIVIILVSYFGCKAWKKHDDDD